jgi:NAD(P)-dependent dehydrogenase (short-subunit alcohol dehydrogenase family)
MAAAGADRQEQGDGMTSPRKVAFISGGSRAIGAACAAALAEAGFDVAITSRSLDEGGPPAAPGGPPPSLDAAVAGVERAGGRCLALGAELTDPASVAAAVTTVLERWGRIDVVVHNGRYMGPGNMDRFLQTSVALLRTQMEANLFAPLLIDQMVLPQMIANGGGLLVNMTSYAGYASPLRAGGWGMGYAVSKGALQRVAGMLRAEHGEQGIVCLNLQPGMVAEAGGRGAPPETSGRVVAWLATAPEAAGFNGQTVEAQPLCHRLGLLPGWDGPAPEGPARIDYDLAGYNAREGLGS